MRIRTLGWLALAWGCTEADPTPSAVVDLGAQVDGAALDAGPRDAAPDRSAPDLALPDAEPLDAAQPDATPADAGPADLGQSPDAGAPCAQLADCAAPQFCDFPAGQCGGLGACTDRPGECAETAPGDAVCACDGRSYPSACAAAQAGVAVDQPGPCAAPEPCDVDAECGADAFCASLPGACGGQGRCQPRPDGCDDVFEPVCGCDGAEYPNACEAAAAAVSLADAAACGPPPCASHRDCGDAEYCHKPACDAPQGECAPRPAMCEAVLAPVCSCDGVTYDNLCAAASAGRNVAGDGECPPPECAENADCALDEWCARPDAACGAVGACAPRPQACGQIFRPVCGCDGNTYSNDCVAHSQGVVVLEAGECPGCMHRNDCDGEQYCNHPTGGCGQPGECAPIPGACPRILRPVCACNGMTYGNDCEAARAGESVAYEGECRGR